MTTVKRRHYCYSFDITSQTIQLVEIAQPVLQITTKMLCNIRVHSVLENISGKLKCLGEFGKNSKSQGVFRSFKIVPISL